jgi:hypothetical protein
MDEEQGNVIDGTARARQWRGSRRQSRASSGRDELRSDAPKSIAASLLVPADLVAPGAARGRTEQGLGDEADIPSVDRDIAAATADPPLNGQNLFLSADAMAPTEPASRHGHGGIAPIGLAHDQARRLRRSIADRRSPRAFGGTRAVRACVILSLIGAVVVVALAEDSHGTRSLAGLGGAAQPPVLGLGRSALLSVAADPIAGQRAAGAARTTSVHRRPRRLGPKKHAAAHAAPAQRTVHTSAPASSYTPPPSAAAEPARSSDSGSSSSQRAGPTGPISLIGAGTTPSG